MNKKSLSANKRSLSTSKQKTGISLRKTTWYHIRRSPFQSLAAVMVMWLNFLVATVLIVLVFAFSTLLRYFESRPEVTAFLKDSVTEAQVQELKQRVFGIEGVKEQNKDNPLLLEMVTANILPASLEISAVSPDQLNKIAEFLKKEAGVEEVVFQKDVAEKLSSWIKAVRNGGVTTVSFLSFVSLMVIMVIVGMKIASHQDEISALRSLGAADSYIQAPFLLEGVIYGVVGALLSSFS